MFLIAECLSQSKKKEQDIWRTTSCSGGYQPYRLQFASIIRNIYNTDIFATGFFKGKTIWLDR